MAKLKKYQYGGSAKYMAAKRMKDKIRTEARKMAAPTRVSPILQSKMMAFEPYMRSAPSKAAFRARMRKYPVKHEIIKNATPESPSIAYKVIPPSKPISKRKDLSRLLGKPQKGKMIKGGSLRNPKKHR